MVSHVNIYQVNNSLFLLNKYFILVLSILIIGNNKLFGQSAKFDVNSEIGCDPFTVVVTDLSGAHDTTSVNYDWGDGSPLDSTEFHTYSQPGIYTIIQTVANANPRQDTMDIEVIDLFPPVFQTLNCKNAVGSVLIEDSQFDAYEINWGDGDSEIGPAYSIISHDYGIIGIYDVVVKGLVNGAQSPSDSSNVNCLSTTKILNNNPEIYVGNPPHLQVAIVLNTDKDQGSIWVTLDATSPLNNFIVEIMDQNQASFIAIDTVYGQSGLVYNYTIENLNTVDNFYCVRLVAFDPCDGERFPSNTGCSINLQTTARSGQNEINWSTNSTDFKNYWVYRDGLLISTINNQGQTQFIDDQVLCGITYEYQIIMNENLNFQSLSDTSFTTAVSTETPEPILNISATIIDQDINIAWEEPQNFVPVGYIISRSTDGESFEVLDTLTDTDYLDSELFTQSTTYYYKISYYDACGNLSEESIVARPILLVQEFDKTLSWSAYQGWENGVGDYLLEKYDETGQMIESVNLGLSTSYSEDEMTNPYQKIIYKIIVTPVDGTNGNVESNLLEVIYKSKVTFPNAFSPDGDGTNDIFNFKSKYILGVNMKIYNRWGELVYQTSDVDQGWNGTVNGKQAPLGTYIYYAELVDDMGINFVKSGEIILIR